MRSTWAPVRWPTPCSTSAGARHACVRPDTRTPVGTRPPRRVASSLFNVRRRIARVRHNGYLEPIWRGLYASDQLPIDVIISPEVEVANGIVRRLRTPGAFDTVSLADGRVHLLGVHCNTGPCSLVGRRMKELSSSGGSGIVVGAIVRNGQAFVPRGEDQVQQGDDVYVITERSHLDRVMTYLGHEEQIARRI